MARPKLIRPATPLLAATIVNGGFSASGSTILTILQGSGGDNYVSGASSVTSSLQITYSGYSISSTTVIYGVMIEVQGLGCTIGYSLDSLKNSIPYLSIPMRFIAGDGVLNFELQARDLVGVIYGGTTVTHGSIPVAANTGDDRFFFVYAFEKKIQRWDVLNLSLEIFTPAPAPIKSTGTYFVFKKVILWPLYMNSPPVVGSSFPALSLAEPAHVWSPDGLPATFASGGLAKPAVHFGQFDPFYLESADLPDVVRVVTSNSPIAPQANFTDDFGIITPRPDDRGLVVPKVDLVQTDDSTRPTQYIHGKSGWLIPATGDYVWTNWQSIQGRAVATRPVAPVLTATINGDQVDLTGYSCDNLLPPWYSGYAGTSPPDLTLMEHPTVTASLNTLSLLAAYNTTLQRADYVFRVTRNTSSGAINLTTQHVRVQGSKVYAVTCYVRCTGTNVLLCHLNWYDNTGAFISQTTNVINGATSSSRVLRQGTVTSPSNAAYATVQFVVSTAGVGDTMDLDSISFGRYNGSTIPDFNAGGYIWGNAAFRLGCAKPLSGNTYWWQEEETAFNTALTEVTTAPRTGTHHLQWVSNGSSVLVMPLYRHYLPEAIPSGTVVSTKAWVRSVTTQGQCTIGLRFVDSDGEIISETWSTTTALTSTSTYAAFRLNGATVPDGTIAIFLLLAFPTNSNITYYIDDIYVVFNAGGETDGLNFGGYSIGAPHAGFLGYYVIERQLANSSVWTPIAIKQITPISDVAFSDFVVPEGMTFKYRARVLGLMDGRLVEGQYSAEQSVSTSSPGGQWTLWDPSSDAKGPLRFDIEGSTGELKTALQAALAMYSPVGRDRRVLTKDTSKGQIFDFTVDLVSAADFALWETYHQDRNVLILTRTSTGECWPVVATSDFNVRIRNTTPTQYMIDVVLEEVDVPAVW